MLLLLNFFESILSGVHVNRLFYLKTNCLPDVLQNVGINVLVVYLNFTDNYRYGLKCIKYILDILVGHFYEIYTSHHGLIQDVIKSTCTIFR